MIGQEYRDTVIQIHVPVSLLTVGVDQPTALVLLINVTMFVSLKVLVKNKQINHSELDFLLRFPVQANVTSPVDFLNHISWGGIKVLIRSCHTYCYLKHSGNHVRCLSAEHVYIECVRLIMLSVARS